jgi:hypothetical protein
MQEGVNTGGTAAASGLPGYPVQKNPSPQKTPVNATVPYNQGSGAGVGGGLNPYPVFPAGGTGYPTGPANSTGSYPHSNSPTPPYSTSSAGGTTIINGNGNQYPQNRVNYEDGSTIPKSNTFTSYESHQSPSQRFVPKESGSRTPDNMGQYSNTPNQGSRSADSTPRPRERSAQITLPTIPSEFPEIKNLSNFQLEKLSSDEVALMVRL